MTDDSHNFDVVAQIAALRRYAWSLTRDDVDAEDLVHEALVRAYAGRHSFKPGGNLRTWLLSVLHNVFIDALRRRKADTDRMRRAEELTETLSPPSQEVWMRFVEVRKAFLGLPDEQRAALHLVAVDGLSYQDAAAALDIPVGTLMSRLGRARAALRALEEDGSRTGEETQKDERRPPRLRIVGGADESRS